MAKALRVGIIGIVSAYTVHYAEDLNNVPGVEIVGIAHLGRDAQYIEDSLSLPWLKNYPKTIPDIARTYNVPVVASAEELYERGAEAVTVCTEDCLHSHYAVEALARDVHVLVPKPFAHTMQEVEALTAAAAKSRATLTPSLPVRYNALWQTAKQALGEKGLGEPLSARVQITHHLSTGPWKSDPTKAAGPEFESGFYHVDGLCYLMQDEPVRVYAVGCNYLHKELPTFDTAKLVVEFRGGAIASADFYCGCHVPLPNQDLDLVARDGAVRIERDYTWNAQVVRIFSADGVRVEAPAITFRQDEVAHWVDICRENDRAEASRLLAEGVRSARLMMAFRQSWQSGQIVELGAGQPAAQS